MREYLILSNNPLVPACMEGQGTFTIRLYPEKSLRDILVLVRDLVYEGHSLYTHPLSGSVKPNETPYKSVVVSLKKHSFDAEQSLLISNAIAAADKFPPVRRELSRQVLEDFQLIDYCLLAGAIGFDAEAGLRNRRHGSGKKEFI